MSRKAGQRTMTSTAGKGTPFAYYSGGMQVFSFGGRGLEEVGRFIDQGGNNFWGVETFRSKKFGRLFAGSDRDFGLSILRYTGCG